MPMLSPEALERELSKGSSGGVFFLFGDEEYLKEEAVNGIVAAHVEAGTRDFNLDQLRAGETDPETMASVIATPPLMAPWRVVVVREAQALASAPRLRAVVQSTADHAPPGLALVLVAQLPPRSKAAFYQHLRRAARAVEFTAPDIADVPGWLMHRAKREDVDLEPAAARALAAAIGTDLGMLATELAKLRDFVGDRRRVGVADIEQAVGPVARQNRWDWFDMVGGRDLAGARRGLRTLLDSGESGVGLLIGLGSHLLRLALAATGGVQALERHLPPHQRWLARRLSQQARRWSAAQLDAALDDLLRADRLLKSASLDDAAVLEEALLRMAGRMPAAA
jgi:DNA polymerase III subunit delta